MNGKYVVFAIVGITLIFGIGVWYTQTRAYYAPVQLGELRLLGQDGAEIVVAPQSGIEGIDAATSPLRFRACFTLGEEDVIRLLAEASVHAEPEPLIAPGWFDCYDATQIGADLEASQATALTGTIEIARGVDRVIALYPDGRGFAWHQLNGTLE